MDRKDGQLGMTKDPVRARSKKSLLQPGAEVGGRLGAALGPPVHPKSGKGSWVGGNLLRVSGREIPSVRGHRGELVDLESSERSSALTCYSILCDLYFLASPKPL